MRDTLKCLENIIPDLELISFQNIGVQEALLNKKMLLAFDTGTGKTFTYSLFVRALLNRSPEKKHIFVIIHDSLEQATKDIGNLVYAPVAAFSSSSGQYGRLKRGWDRLSVILLTYECFNNDDIMLFLYDKLPEIESFTIDEAHHAANWDSSDSGFMLRAICKYIPYVVELTATPITSKQVQYYQLLNIIDRNLSPRRDETFMGKYSERYFPVNREEYGIKGNYKTTLELVEPSVNQLGDISGIIFKVLKGTGSINQVTSLLNIVRDRLAKSKSVIIYIHYHDTRLWVEEHLQKVGISYVSLHGKITKREERESILNTFASGNVDVLITSVAESLNIDADVVIFYEFTTKLKQVMGRAHRGLESKELELVFILTKNTLEIDYFMKYIYQRSLTIQCLLRKDYSEFIQIGEQVKGMSIKDD